MPGLQEAFYIIGIIFMSLMLLFIILLIASVIVIRRKISNIENHIQQKIDDVANIATRGGEVAAKVGSKLAGAAAKQVRKTARKMR